MFFINSEIPLVNNVCFPFISKATNGWITAQLSFDFRWLHFFKNIYPLSFFWPWEHEEVCWEFSRQNYVDCHNLHKFVVHFYFHDYFFPLPKKINSFILRFIGIYPGAIFTTYTGETTSSSSWGLYIVWVFNENAVSSSQSGSWGMTAVGQLAFSIKVVMMWKLGMPSRDQEDWDSIPGSWHCWR